MEEKKRYKFGLRKKLVLLTTILALITYTISALFIYILYPYVKEYIHQMPFTIITLVLGIIWSGILTFVAAGFITKPLKQIEVIALRAANGSICEDAVISKSDDEIRSLGLAFNHMLGSLREMVTQINENFRETNDKVVSISQKSIYATKQADGIAKTINEIAAGADNSALSIQRTVESVEEVIQLAEEVQDKAKASEKVSANMVKDLDVSKQVIQSLISGIEQLAEDNKESMQTVKRLEGNATKVEQIIQLVGDIAAQTNLLALNASIEAARAGEHGKGFAVVAEEVRKLADESAKAVNGITDLIKNIQAEVQNVVQQIANQVETANDGVAKGTKTNEVIAQMADTINDMADMAKSITILVEQQMDGVRQTASQSEEVAAIAEETSAGAQEVASSATEQGNVIEEVDHLAQVLKVEAEKLKETIRRFKL
jgi:methyl-accepting chemotaxis protein